LNAVVKDHAECAASCAWRFRSVHARHVASWSTGLYTIHEQRSAVGVASGAVTPWSDFERELRQASLPLYSLETVHARCRVRFAGSACKTDLLHERADDARSGGIPLHAKDRSARACWSSRRAGGAESRLGTVVDLSSSATARRAAVADGVNGFA